MDRRELDFSLKPTQETYEAFQHAYDIFNYVLFQGELPGCLITFQRRPRSSGYFSGDRFKDRRVGQNGEKRCDEIALNPAHFHDHSVEFTLSILVHEMVHLWQHHYGKAGRGRYHNRQWAEKMKSLGLQPSDTGKEGGQEIGDSMTHSIIEGGPFAQAAQDLIAQGFEIAWEDTPPEVGAEDEGSPEGLSPNGANKARARKRKSGKRVKYTCPICSLNAWARHDARLLCGEDKVPMEAETLTFSPL